MCLLPLLYIPTMLCRSCPTLSWGGHRVCTPPFSQDPTILPQVLPGPPSEPLQTGRPPSPPMSSRPHLDHIPAEGLCLSSPKHRSCISRGHLAQLPVFRLIFLPRRPSPFLRLAPTNSAIRVSSASVLSRRSHASSQDGVRGPSPSPQDLSICNSPACTGGNYLPPCLSPTRCEHLEIRSDIICLCLHWTWAGLAHSRCSLNALWNECKKAVQVCMGVLWAGAVSCVTKA